MINVIVITLTKVPSSLRGDLTKWCQEIQTGVYVGNVNARVRERLWERINKNIGQGEATLVYNTNSELGYTFRTTRRDIEVVDAEGIPLVKSLVKVDNCRRHEFSNAYKYHEAKVRKKAKAHQTSSFVSLDLETTGLTPTSNQIISIGAVKKEANKVSSFYRLIKLRPGKTIPANILKTTKLNPSTLNTKGVDIKEAMIDLRYFIGRMPVIGYNLTFDETFLQSAVIKNNLIQFSNRMVDILPYVKRVDKFCDNYQLSTILTKYGIKNEEPHNSLSDAKATMELTNKLIEKYGFEI